MQPILTIDLTTQKIGSYSVPVEWEREYLGGASLGARILLKSLTRDLDPLSPESPLLILNGPLSGTAGPTVGRFVVCGKSPLTGLWAESNCGGFWGPELRMAGFDGVWIVGKAVQPVYIWICDRQVEIRDASMMWGQDTYEIQNTLKKETGINIWNKYAIFLHVNIILIIFIGCSTINPNTSGRELPTCL